MSLRGADCARLLISATKRHSIPLSAAPIFALDAPRLSALQLRSALCDKFIATSGGTARVLACFSVVRRPLQGQRLPWHGHGSSSRLSPFIPERERRQRRITVFVHAVNRCADVRKPSPRPPSPARTRPSRIP